MRFSLFDNLRLEKLRERMQWTICNDCMLEVYGIKFGSYLKIINLNLNFI